MKRLLFTSLFLLTWAALGLADPTVTSGSCGTNTWCVDGSTLTLTGTDLDRSTIVIGDNTDVSGTVKCAITTKSTTELACTLSIGNYMGEYPVYIDNEYVGNIIVGAFYERQPSDFELWNKNGIETESFVSSMSTSDLVVGKDWTLYGNYSSTATYEILFFNTQADIVDGSPGLPSCTTVEVQRVMSLGSVQSPYNALVCKGVKTFLGSMGMYGVLVRDTATKRFLPGAATLWLTMVTFPPSSVTATLTGDCATNSANCVTGASLVFTGTNLNTRVPKVIKNGRKFFVNFSIGYGTTEANKIITCETTAVGENTATCSLTVGSGVTPGLYPVYVINQACNMGMTADPVHVGNLLIGTFYDYNPSGWNTAPLPTVNYSLSAIPARFPVTGDSFVFYGVFNPSATYTVHPYNVQKEMADATYGHPTCDNVVVSATTLTCTIAAKIGVMGMFRFLIQDNTNWYLNGSTTLPAITVAPVNPTVTSATFSNNVMTVTGTNLQTRPPYAGSKHKHHINFTIGFNKQIPCVTTATDPSAGTASCKMTVDSNTPIGSYPVYVINQLCDMGMTADPVLVGGVSYGGANDWKWVPLSSSAYLSNYSAVSPSSLQDGDKLNFVGNFTPSSTYTVTLGENAPTCTEVTVVNAQLLQCTYHAKVGFTSEVTLRVQESSSKAYIAYVPSSSSTRALASPSPSLTVYPPAPSVTAVSGDCISDSAKCTTGGKLTFTIQNADPTPANNRFVFDHSGISCGSPSVSGTTVTCTLTVTAPANTRSLMTFQTAANLNQWTTAVPIGYLTIGGSGPAVSSVIAGVSGSSGGGSNGNTETVTVTKQNNAAVAAAVVFAILFLIVVIVLICLLVCCKVQRKRKVPRGLEYVENPNGFENYNAEMHATAKPTA